MKYTGLTVEQYERVVEIAKKQEKTIDEIVDEVIDWCDTYDTIDEILNDFETL